MGLLGSAKENKGSEEQELSELPELSEEKPPENNNSQEEEELPREETPGDNQTSFEVPDFSDEDFDFNTESMFSDKETQEPEQTTNETRELPVFYTEKSKENIPEETSYSTLKKQVFSDENTKKPEIYLEKKQYGRLLLSEDLLLRNSKTMLEEMNNIYTFDKEETETSNSIKKDCLAIQRALMSIDTELFEKEDTK